MRIKNIVSFVAFISLIMIVASCHVEKRIYRKGYHIVWHHSKEKNVRSVNKAATVKTEVIEKEIAEVIAAANINENEIILLKHKPLLTFNKDTCGDVLLLQNADEISVKVIEINEQAIKYKRCDNINGPTYTIAKNKVALIKYANGIKEVIQQDAPVRTKEPELIKKDTGPRKVNMVGLISLIAHIAVSILSRGVTASATTGLGIAGFIVIIGLAALVMAYVALFQFRNEPQRYSGRWMPIVVICLDLAGILIVALLLAAFAQLGGVSAGPFIAILLVLFLILLGLMIFALTPKKDLNTDPNSKR